MQASSNSPSLRKFHLYGLCLNAAVLLVGLKGLDLGSLVAPLLLATGIASGFLGIACYRESLFVRINACLFFLFLGIAFLVGKSQPTQAVRLAACLCFLLLIKYCFPVEGFSRRFFQFFLGGYVLSTTAGLMAVVGLWEPSDLFLPVYQTFRFAGLYNATILGIVSAVLAIWLLDELVYPKMMRAHWVVKSLLFGYSLFIMLMTLTRSAWIGFAAGGWRTSSSTLPVGTSRGSYCVRSRRSCSCWRSSWGPWSGPGCTTWSTTGSWSIRCREPRTQRPTGRSWSTPGKRCGCRSRTRSGWG